MRHARRPCERDSRRHGHDRALPGSAARSIPGLFLDISRGASRLRQNLAGRLRPIRRGMDRGSTTGSIPQRASQPSQPLPQASPAENNRSAFASRRGISVAEQADVRTGEPAGARKSARTHGSNGARAFRGCLLRRAGVVSIGQARGAGARRSCAKGDLCDHRIIGRRADR